MTVSRRETRLEDVDSEERRTIRERNHLGRTMRMYKVLRRTLSAFISC